MSFGLLEAGLVSAGLAGGYSLGSKLRQVLQEASAADGQHQRVGDAAKRGTREGGSLSQLPSSLASRWVGNEEAMTLTVMLVGEPGAGKTLLCERLAAEDGIVGRETLPRTLAPQWHAVQLDLPSVGRVSVQLLDTPGGLPEVSVIQANRPSSHLTHSQATPVTHPPALCPCAVAAQLSVPFYRDVQACILVFDVGSSLSFARMKAFWYSATRLHRFHTPGARQKPGSTVVLAHIIDERRERQVTRREAAAWCQQQKLPYFETHPAERPCPRVLTHLGSVVLQGGEEAGAEA